MKKNKIELSKFHYFICGLVLMGICVSTMIYIKTLPKQEKIEAASILPQSEQEIINKCLNLSIVEASKCLVDNVNPFYSYNVTDDKEELNLNDLKEIGGDCKDWSELYARLGKELGFYATPPTIRTRNNSNHQIAILSNKYAYCLIDSTREQSFSRCIEIIRE